MGKRGFRAGEWTGKLWVGTSSWEKSWGIRLDAKGASKLVWSSRIGGMVPGRGGQWGRRTVVETSVLGYGRGVGGEILECDSGIYWIKVMKFLE